MKIVITPNKLKGKILIPSDKSFCHRAIISACLAQGDSIIKNVNMCDDVKNTINILRQIFDVKIINNDVYIKGKVLKSKIYSVQIEESASTLRFLLPVLSFLCKNELEFHVSKRLKQRGVGEYFKLAKNNIKESFDTYIVKNFVDQKEYVVDASESSQYVSGILFLATTLKHDTKIILNKNISSTSYIDLTIDVLNRFGADIKRDNETIFIKQKELYGKEIECPADGSIFLYYQILNKHGSNIKIANANCESIHPDYELANNIIDNNELCEFDLKNNPDAIYSLCLLNKYTNKPIFLKNIDRLKNKEIDRVQALIEFLDKTKSKYIKSNNTLIINKIEVLKTEFDSKNDHRLVMFYTALSIIANKKIKIKNAECISKSYPFFFEDIKKLGGKIEVINEYKQLSYKIINHKTNILLTDVSRYKNRNLANGKVCVITDKNIDEEYVKRIERMLLNNNVAKIDLYRINKAGEKIKSIDEVKRILGFLLQKEYSKKDYLIALGGGVITDFTGFVGSIYKRGIKTIYIPTTLIAQVDAAIGGKTGINLDEIKNPIGTFYNPEEIVIDKEFLKTLSKKDIISGLVEIIKIASTFNQKLFFDIYDSNDLSNLEKWIYEAIKLKINIIEKDPFDKNERKALNFGHTFGHAIELKEHIPHGIAVGKGILEECNNEFLINILNKYKIEKCTNTSLKQVLNNIENDKKVQDNKITMVELINIGKCKLISKDVNEIKRRCD